MLKRSAIAGVLVALGVVALSTNAQAATLKQLIALGPEPNGFTNILDDSSRENLIQNDLGDGDPTNDNTLDVGDSIRGIIRFDVLDANGTTHELDPSDGNVQVSGLFQTLVKSKTSVGFDANGNEQFIFAFEPDPTFVEANALGLTGAMVLMYTDTNEDFTFDGGSPAIDEANASDGTFFWAMGMNGTFGAGDVTDLGEGWITENTYDQVQFLTFQTGIFKISLNRVLGGNGAGDGIRLGVLPSNFDATKFTQFSGEGSFRLPTGNTYWQVHDSADFSFQAIVPLPAAAWAGFAMLGLLGVGRKLRRRSA